MDGLRSVSDGAQMSPFDDGKMASVGLRGLGVGIGHE